MKAIEPAEFEYLKVVRNFIDAQIERHQNLSLELEDKIISEGKKFAMDDPFGSIYGGYELTELHYSIERKIQRSESSKQEAYFLKKLKANPYFARIDFKEDGYDCESFYIGLKSLFDEKELSPYVYDWRAPISALFYEDFDDIAYYAAPNGIIEGKIEKKRQYKFKDGELVYCFDSTIKIDDVILQSALSENSTERLKVIVNSIQKEQNKAIRFGANQNLIVCGPAGSGKTSVGFHRIAYLLYRHRENLSSAQVVMFTGSNIFASYVSDIIPELGEAPIKDFSFYSLTKQLSESFKILDYYELAEALINKSEDRLWSVRIKHSDEFISFIEKYIKKSSVKFSDCELFDDVVFTGSSISSFLKRHSKTTAFAEKLELIVELTNEKIDDYFKNNYEKIYKIASDQSSILDNTAEYVEEMQKEIKAKTSKRLEEELDTDDFKTLHSIFKSYEKQNPNKSKLLKAFELDLANETIKFEDAMLVLFIKCLLGKIETDDNTRHVLVDEAQDFSPLQHRIIKYLYSKARFTILTDSRQAIVPAVNSADLSALSKIYSAKTLELQKSYRSTQQISSFAKNLINSQDYESFERNGEDVQEIESDDIISLLGQEIKNAQGSFAIITKTTPQAKSLYNRLILDVDVEIYDNKNKVFSSKPSIIPVVYSKGLEFDKVIIVNDEENSFYGDENKAYFYMAATRALHQLKIVKEKNLLP